MRKITLFGGTGGLGKQVAPLLAKKYQVMALGSKDVDIRNEADLAEFFKNNPPEIVINLSGTSKDAMLHRLRLDIDDAQMVNVNIFGNLNLMGEALPHMRESGYGRIILASSILSTRAVPGTGIYSACKAFIDSLVRTASAENIGKGITANSIRLGYFDGGMCHRLPKKVKEPIRESIGLKRWGSIQELAQTIEFLIETEYITGQNLEISGGLQ